MLNNTLEALLALVHATLAIVASFTTNPCGERYRAEPGPRDDNAHRGRT
jgi:hypothetical protein